MFTDPQWPWAKQSSYRRWMNEWIFMNINLRICRTFWVYDPLLPFRLSQALQFKVDEATCETEVLEKKVQNYVSDISTMEDLLSSKVFNTFVARVKGSKFEHLWLIIALFLHVQNRSIALLNKKSQGGESNIKLVFCLDCNDALEQERECKELQECQMELRSSDSEKHRLKERVESLESSLKEVGGKPHSKLHVLFHYNR